MLFIGQNLKHIHMTYSFLELLIFLWLTLDISYLEFICHRTKEILMGNQSWNTNQELVADIDVQKSCFLM